MSAGSTAGSQSTMTFFRPVQPSSTPLPTVVRDAGRVSSVRLTQLRKAPSPRVVMEPNSSTQARLLSAKASAPMVVNQPQ